MKQKIIVLFSALLVAFALVPVSFASAYGTLDPIVVGDDGVITSFGNWQNYFANPGVGGNYYFQVDEFLSYLMDNNIPFVSTSVSGIWDESMPDKGGLSGSRYSITIPYDTNAIFSIDDNDVITMSTTKRRNTLQMTVDTNKYIQTNQTVNTAIDNCPPFSNPKIPNDGSMPVTTINTLKYYNPNGGSIGENAMIPPVPINDQDMLDIPVGTLRLTSPKNNATLTVGDSGAELQILIDGKAGYLNEFPSWFPDIAGVFYPTYMNDAMKKDFAISVNGETVNAKVDIFNMFGNRKDWQENEYVTFEGIYSLPIKELKEGPCTITFGANVLMPNAEDIYYMEWKSVTVELNIYFQKDLNGDGYDDDTGEKLVNGALLDNDGDGIPDGNYTKPTDENGTDFFEGFVNSIKNVPEYTSEISRAFSSIFNMFPSPIPQLAVTGIVIMIFVAVISFIRGA